MCRNHNKSLRGLGPSSSKLWEINEGSGDDFGEICADPPEYSFPICGDDGSFPPPDVGELRDKPFINLDFCLLFKQTEQSCFYFLLLIAFSSK